MLKPLMMFTENIVMIFPQIDIPSCFVGLILENCKLPLANHGHVVLADPSPILLYPISSTEVRCLVDIPGQKVPSVANGEMAHYLRTAVAPQVPLLIGFSCRFLNLVLYVFFFIWHLEVQESALLACLLISRISYSSYHPSCMLPSLLQLRRET